jgi:uncharacterized protein
MLIQFSVKNYRSIKDEQTLSLVAGSYSELLNENTFEPGALKTNRLLHSAAIYGPNAAGKSNLLMALRTMETIVLRSTNQGDALPVVSFLLDEATENAPSEFEIQFVAESVRYQYGFSASCEKIIEEWLIAYPKGHAQRWFSRAWVNEKKSYDWEMGSKLSGNKQDWQEATRDNALFLSTANLLNSKQLASVYAWFKYNLHMTGMAGWPDEFTASLCQQALQRNRVMEFLHAADLDIQAISVEAQKMTTKHLPDGMPEKLKSAILDDMKDRDVFDIKTSHKTAQGKTVRFDLDEESDGTQKLFAFAGPWLDTLKNGYVMCVDELHNSLHPNLVEFLVKLFHNPETNPNNAQLIFTTHDTSILNQKVLRRDQIWFCEKDDMQATKLYPLSDYSPKKDRENLEAAYLSGRYGALPYLRPISDIKAK